MDIIEVSSLPEEKDYELLGEQTPPGACDYCGITCLGWVKFETNGNETWWNCPIPSCRQKNYINYKVTIQDES